MRSTKRQILVIATSSLLGVALLGGVAMAAIGTPMGMAGTFASLPGPVGAVASHLGGGGAFLEAAATYIGITADELRAQLRAGKTLTQIAEENGKTREGLVAAMIAAGQTELTERVERVVDQTMPDRIGHGVKVFFGRELTEAALTYLGITPGEYLDLAREGNSLSEIAATNGLARDGLIAAMTAAGNAAIDAAETAGRITADQATTARGQLAEKVEQLADAERPFFPGRGHGPRGGFGR